ncbi:hypothetical protein TNCV_4714711 [Trichonephila clavipes]|nr:hypothetical protein TNCV_4714711 [Trichonephila clavipes]
MNLPMGEKRSIFTHLLKTRSHLAGLTTGYMEFLMIWKIPSGIHAVDCAERKFSLTTILVFKSRTGQHADRVWICGL